MSDKTCAGVKKDGDNIKLPRGQIAWERWLDAGGRLVKIVTSNADRTKWTLFAIDGNGKATAEATAKTPTAFRQKPASQRRKGAAET